MSRQTYDDDFKARAIALSLEVGPAEAARQLNVPKAGTIRSWCSRAGVATVAAAEQTQAAVKQRQANAADRRARLADRLLEIAEMSVDRTEGLLADASLRDVVGLFTRAIHDHQLLAGEATSRHETVDVDAAHALIDELAAKRATRAA